MALVTKGKEQIRNKSVLLFSGGMDCLCVNQLYNPDIILHINYGGKYGEQEKKTLQKLIELGAIDKNKVVEYDIGTWLGDRERDDLIIPNRNAYFVLLASELGEAIMLASVKGDRSFDKDNLFYQNMNDLLDHMWDTQHWTEKRKFWVYSPVKELTKNELICKFLDNGGKEEWLLASYSCYSGHDKPCGACKPCIRKAIALSNSRVSIPEDYFENNPKEFKEFLELKDDITQGKYRGDEDKDICKFMNWEYNGS